MKEHGVVGIEGIDTRALVRHLRVKAFAAALFQRKT
jgi:carbamoylphosphate synthase small subunit